MSLIKQLERPVDARPLALARIGVGIAAGAIGLETWRLLVKLSAPGALTVPGVDWLPGPSRGQAALVLAVWTVLALALCLGLFARCAAAGLGLLAVSTMLVDQQAYSNHLALMVILMVLLAWAPCTTAWSLDTLRGRGARAVPYWPVFLLKVQISTVYGFAALSKLNDQFLSGDVLAAALRQPFAGLGEPMLVAASVATIGTELFLAVALWSPRLQRVAFAVGFGLHVAIVAGITNFAPLVPFALLMMSNYALFLPPLAAARLMDRLERLRPLPVS